MKLGESKKNVKIEINRAQIQSRERKIKTLRLTKLRGMSKELNSRDE